MGAKLFIISNRLPVKAVRTALGVEFVRSEGGLATGLSSLSLPVERHWIGWPGIHPGNEDEKARMTVYLENMNFHPVYLTPRQIQDYYEGYSNSTLWPLCHYFFSYIRYENQHWDAYREVNRLFGEAAAQLIGPDDIVWVQDYHLMLLPALLRRSHPDVSVGYFHHIPFPSYELFRVLPEREQILRGLLGADLIGFHTPTYMQHFTNSVSRVLDIEFGLDETQLTDRVVHTDAYPMGINYALYHDAPLKPTVRRHIRALRNTFGANRLMLSVDRLDYSKGILHRLRGFTLFLETHPEYREKVSLVMIIVPSRDKVERYASLKARIDEAIGAVNGAYSTMNWHPVYYFYHSFRFEELTAMYHIADAALITPLRDGMNLVAKEYVAAKRDTPGTLILSEMAGASLELKDAVIVNPNDPEQIAEAIFTALEMPREEQLQRLRSMQSVVSVQTVHKWASDFVQELEHIHRKNGRLHEKILRTESLSDIRERYRKAAHRLLVFDYDGTLVPFRRHPQDAKPTPALVELLRRYTEIPSNRVVISSGRDPATLEGWFGFLPLGLAAEHGAFYKEEGRWHENVPAQVWDPEILSLLRKITDKTPGSFLETKRTALVWHYRNVDPELALLREEQLITLLSEPCARCGLRIMPGNKIVEVKSAVYSKGSEIQRLLAESRYDFMLALGDDVTDEDMFRALPPEAVTVKIGALSKTARYNLPRQAETLPFLKELLAVKE